MNNILKIRSINDIHLEFGDFTVRPLPEDKETVLVLAGDIGIVHKTTQLKDYVTFMERCSKQFREVVVIMGNHEHYHGSFKKTATVIRNAIQHLDNVHLLEKSVHVIDNVAFIGATLWTDCDNGSPHAVYLFNGMADAKLIRTGHTSDKDPYQRKFNSGDTILDHIKAKDFIEKEIVVQREAGRKIVLVVHHGITPKSIAEMYRGDSMNMFFVSDLTLDLMDWNVDLVVHGHLHNFSDYQIDTAGSICQTRVVCNPRGYIGYEGKEQTGFNDSLIIEV